MIGKVDLIMVLIIIVTASMMFGLHIMKTVDDKLKTTKVYVPPPIVNLSVCDDGEGKYNLCKCKNDESTIDNSEIEPFDNINYETIDKPISDPRTSDISTFGVNTTDKVLTNQNTTNKPVTDSSKKSVDELNKEMDEESTNKVSPPSCENDKFLGFNYYVNKFISPNDLYKGIRPENPYAESLPLPFNNF
jgi:hypothetical protein